MKKTVFIGSVLSSKFALETLIQGNVKIDLVCSLDENASRNVSDYYPIHELAKDNNIPFIKFKKINDSEVINCIKEIEPDFIFVIGLSQIISGEILDLAKEYVIGFHPTDLPKFRGRAAIPWQIILGVKRSKVSLFKLDNGMDSGDIICKQPYIIKEKDYAMDVYLKVCKSMSKAIQESINSIYKGNVNFKKQNNYEATYLLARRPEDGKIDWNTSGKEIETLIRATSKPYPGAFSYYKDKKIIFWKANIQENRQYIGIPGQIAWIGKNKEVGIIATDSLVVVTEYDVIDDEVSLTVGHKFK